ncbi:MAG: WxcM-like domain-containing protein [Oceanospirillaceae bacterium]|nr:WxcM-like domain-containing protein [Oceanospirillaceae bacterium]
MKDSSVYSCSIVELPRISDGQGSITAVNNGIEIPFDTRRVYYLYDVPSGSERGGHAHKALHQLIVAAAGSFVITVDDGKIKRSFHLSRPNMGLYLPPGLWRSLHDFSGGGICMVLASEAYSEEDYIREYVDFLEYKK